MSSTMKNITIALVLITVAFVGYYMYAQNGAESGEGDMSLTQDMLTNTQVFIERRALLDKTTIDTEIFSDPVFKSYKTFNTPILEESVGRPNPFGKTTGNSTGGF